MAKTLKKQKNKDKINKSEIGKKKGSDCEQYPSFSFRYLTTNKKFNFDFFNDTNQEKFVKLNDLLYRMKEISENDYKYWLSKGKIYGCETIPLWKIRFRSKLIKDDKTGEEYELSDDEKIYVFRFYQQKCRLLGFRLESCPVFYIMGFDFDFSAYDHG